MAIAAPFPAARTAPVRRSAATRPVSRPASRPASAARASDGLVLTRRGRIVLGVASTVFLLLVVLFSGRLTADAGTSLADQGQATGVVVVQPGETLWQIAQAVAPDADPRATITAIRELNGLDATTVVAGQSIVVPRVA